MNNILTTNPPKGTRDWLPEEFAIRKYIFDTWRRVCTSFGYREYLTPIMESAEIYRAKSGEDVGGKELMTFFDRAGRELAIRPEMTPSVTRMVAGIYNAASKPLRLFSIANFVRNEKPQRGRNREFWQLNVDIFGTDSMLADLEILQISLEIMLSFAPPAGSFTLCLNNRKLIDYILVEYAQVASEQIIPTVRILDKWSKLEPQELEQLLRGVGLVSGQIDKLRLFMSAGSKDELQNSIPEISSSEGFIEIAETIEALTKLGYADWIKFTPNVIRGFDYYDGLIFEVFDNNPDNTRAMFGGGRYNGLSRIFGVEQMPASGFAPGDETARLFLESWGLLEQTKVNTELIYVPILEGANATLIIAKARKLRRMGLNLVTGVELERLGKALEFANKKGFKYVMILGENELREEKYSLKNMQTGEQKTMTEEELTSDTNLIFNFNS